MQNLVTRQIVESLGFIECTKEKRTYIKKNKNQSWLFIRFNRMGPKGLFITWASYFYGCKSIEMLHPLDCVFDSVKECVEGLN